MIDDVDSKVNTVGQSFRASVDEPVMAGDRVVIPKGADAVVMVEDTDFDHRGAGTPMPKQVKAFKAEEAITNAILDSLDPRRPVVLFTTGHGERGTGPKGEGTADFRDRLAKEGAQVRDWESLGKTEVPKRPE